MPPDISRAPKLRLQIAEPESPAIVGTWTTVMFRITNISNANAEGVRLRLILDEVLDHHALEDDELDRQVDAPISRIAPGDYVDFDLVVKPRRTGEAESRAQLLFEGQQLAL